MHGGKDLWNLRHSQSSMMTFRMATRVKGRGRAFEICVLLCAEGIHTVQGEELVLRFEPHASENRHEEFIFLTLIVTLVALSIGIAWMYSTREKTQEPAITLGKVTEAQSTQYLLKDVCQDDGARLVLADEYRVFFYKMTIQEARGYLTSRGYPVNPSWTKPIVTEECVRRRMFEIMSHDIAGKFDGLNIFCSGARI